MILSREQINRYLRHIIIPEISGLGQKKLLDATVMVMAESTKSAAPLAYYLAAVGIGRLVWLGEDDQGKELLFKNLRDLNGDIVISHEFKPGDQGCAIVLGSQDYAARNLGHEITGGITTIAAISRGWKGYLQTFPPSVPRNSILAELRQPNGKYPGDDGMGSIFSTCLLGALSAVETVKQIIGIGTPQYNPFSFDLYNMVFENLEENAPAASRFFVNQGETGPGGNNYPQTDNNTESGAGSLNDYRALIVGTGGLGSPVAYALARAGIGTIGLVDYDKVDISNLNRQILHSTSRLGLPKVDSAEVFLHQLNPEVTIVKHNIAIDADNAIEIISGYDVIIDGVDNFPARYLLNDACFMTGKPMIEAGVAAFEGMGMTIIPGHSMCYRCVFPQMPAAGTVPSCSETGVLGPVPGVMGFIEACEAAKLLTGQGTILTDTLLSFDALELDFEVLQTGRNENCPLCGINPTISQLPNIKPGCNL